MNTNIENTNIPYLYSVLFDEAASNGNVDRMAELLKHWSEHCCFKSDECLVHKFCNDCARGKYITPGNDLEEV